MAVTKKQLIPQEHLREIFEYRDGCLYWKRDPLQRNQWNGEYAGKMAGSFATGGYRRVTFVATERNGLEKSCNIHVHRLIFCFFHGYYPPQVDHIDGDRSNDRIENLRAASTTQNMANRSIQSTNTTGVPGVRMHKRGCYEARIQVSGKRVQIGSFKTLDEARLAIEVASKNLRGEWHRYNQGVDRG